MDEAVSISTMTELHLDAAKVLLTEANAKFDEEVYADVITLTQQFLDQYPDSELVPTVLLIGGLSYLQLDEQEQAALMLQTLLEEYPDSEEAELVQQFLQDDESSSSGPCDALRQEGMALYRQVEYYEAIQKFQDALTCYRETKNRKGEGTAINNLGVAY
jgi:tetratricopeptide (TPR) repeat protein